MTDVFDIAVGQVAGSVVFSEVQTLGGQYEFTASGVAAEVELIEQETARRSVIYLTPGEKLFLFVPSGSYVFRTSVFSGEGRIAVKRMTTAAQLGFLVAKLGALFRRPPREWLAVANRLDRRKREVTGARLGAAPETVARPLAPRPVLPEPAPAAPELGVSIIIPTKYQPELISACVASLRLSARPMEIIIIDNGADDADMVAKLAELAGEPGVRVIRHDIPFNFSQLCNLGAAEARYDALLFLNDDVEARDDVWLEAMLAWAVRPEVGAVGARLLYPSGDLQHAGIASHLVPGPGHPWRGMAEEAWRDHPVISVAGEADAVTAACLMIRREVFAAVGGFDEDRYGVTLNDVDLCLKVRARGLKVIYEPRATLVHKEGQSRSADDAPSQLPRRRAELQAYYEAWPEAAHESAFYPELRRDTDKGTVI